MPIHQSHNNAVVVVNHKDQLLQILQRANVQTLELQLTQLDESKKSYWQSRLSAEKNACGCGEGTAFFLITLVAEAMLIFNDSPLLPNNIMWKILLCVGLAVVSIPIGKAFGRHRATQRFKASIRELFVMLST